MAGADPGSLLAYLRQEAPLSVRPLRALARWHRIVFCVLAGLVALVRYQDAPIDLESFANSGSDLLHGLLGRVYADPFNQSGPLQLLLCTLLHLATATPVAAVAVHVLVDVGAVLAAESGVRWLRRRAELPDSAPIECVVTGVVAVWLIPSGLLWSSHPAEWAIPVLWLAAGWNAYRGRWLAAALVLGAAAGWETWALLAIPMTVLLLASGRRALACAAVAGGVALAFYAPFALTGHFALFQHIWPVSDRAPLHALLPTLTTVDWPIRLIQAALASGGGAAVAVAARRVPAVIWMAPLAAVLIRFLFDPYVLDYYWLAVTLLSLAGVSLLSRHTSWLHALSLAALVYLPLALYWPLYLEVPAALVLLVGCAAGATTARAARRDLLRTLATTPS